MRKFNLKENAAKRMIGMQKAGLSEKDAYADVPAEQAADPGISSGIRIVSPTRWVERPFFKMPLQFLD